MGIEESLAIPHLSHHRTYGSAILGSRSWANTLRIGMGDRAIWSTRWAAPMRGLRSGRDARGHDSFIKEAEAKYVNDDTQRNQWKAPGPVAGPRSHFEYFHPYSPRCNLDQASSVPDVNPQRPIARCGCVAPRQSRKAHDASLLDETGSESDHGHAVFRQPSSSACHCLHQCWQPNLRRRPCQTATAGQTDVRRGRSCWFGWRRRFLSR
jgi:hypothetical protein